MNNTVRIIGGKWRGRKINFPAQLSIRPTSDRVRETLFNWLQTSIVDADCLDCFAGSGVLGFEAISRGAKSITMLDNNAIVIQHLYAYAELLACLNQCEIINTQVPSCTNIPGAPFNIVFVDPPFHQNLASTTLQWLSERQLLNKKGLVYLETERELELNLDSAYAVIREKYTKEVCYRLLQFTAV